MSFHPAFYTYRRYSHIKKSAKTNHEVDPSFAQSKRPLPNKTERWAITALVKTARVICQSNGKTQVILSINGMEFMNMYGHVWNFFHYVGDNPVAAQVMKWHNDKNLIGKLQKFPYQFSLLRSGKESRIKVRVWVDAMDALKNGAKTYDKIQPGSGAQDAYLVLDWSNATLIQETHSAQIAGGKESSQSAPVDTSDSSHITLAAAVLIGGIGILGLMYYFKNRKKA